MAAAAASFAMPAADQPADISMTAPSAAVPPARFAVLGSPIGHSLSPRIHRFAYRFLGLDWSYEACELAADDFPAFIASAKAAGWRGFSVTMPLKAAAAAAADWADETVIKSGFANTLLLTDEGIKAWNTDIAGLRRAAQYYEAANCQQLAILGAGATAANALLAFSHVKDVTLYARQPTAAKALVKRLGANAQVEDISQFVGQQPLTVSALPVGVKTQINAAASGLLLDVNYRPWPSAMAEIWPGKAVSGLPMLIEQAIEQVRIFSSLDAEDESALREGLYREFGLLN